MKYDLVVIGAGPAGMSAAIKAASHGAAVAVVDENSAAGGKLLGQLYKEPKSGWWIGKEVAKNLEDKVRKLGIDYFPEREVWGIFPKWNVMLNRGEVLQSDFVLLATGAAEKAIPVPGWTIPGVMSIGAAQVLNNYHRVKPGNRIAIIGVDALSLTVAHELKLAGAQVTGIYLPPPDNFSNGMASPKQIIAYLSSLADAAPNYFLKIAGKIMRNESIQKIAATVYPYRGMRILGTPLFLRKSILKIEGEGEVEQIKIVKITRDGICDMESIKTIKVDCVCISGGLYPLSELASAAGCQFVYIEELGGHVPLHSNEMETTQTGIFVAGNITGIEGAKVAMAQGELAGTAVSDRLGLLKSGTVIIKKAQERVEIARENALIKFKPEIQKGREIAEQLWNKKAT